MRKGATTAADSITGRSETRPRAALAAAALAWLWLGPASSSAQAPQFGTSVDVVEVYASVTDAKGEPVLGLRADQFEVKEDGRSQHVTTFVEGDFPLSLAVAVDRSWSMAGERLANARAGATALVGQLRPEDQAMLVAIAGSVDVVAPLSRDRAALGRALESLDAWSTTALHDAIVASIDHVQSGTGRRALVLLSDGVDRYSVASAADVLSHARRADVIVYPVAIGRAPSPLFAELAAVTGGRSYHAPRRQDLERAVSQIAGDLRHQYLLGYTPDRPRSVSQGEWRAIDVAVGVPGARVRARDGYVND